MSHGYLLCSRSHASLDGFHRLGWLAHGVVDWIIVIWRMGYFVSREGRFAGRSLVFVEFVKFN
jgi:hypothetical protein